MSNKYTLSQLFQSYYGRSGNPPAFDSIYGELIENEDFNGFAKEVNELFADLHQNEYGENTGGFGYGQSYDSHIAYDGEIIRAKEWDKLLKTVHILARHQNITAQETSNIMTSIEEGVAIGDIIFAFDENDAISLNATINLLRAKRFTANPNTMAVNVDKITTSRDEPWINSMTFEFTANWTSLDCARYFFNTGSTITIANEYTLPEYLDANGNKVYDIGEYIPTTYYYDNPALGTLSPGDPAQNAFWKTMFDTLGNVIFGAVATTSNQSSTSIGYYDLTTTYQKIAGYTARIQYSVESDMIAVYAKFADSTKTKIAFKVVMDNDLTNEAGNEGAFPSIGSSNASPPVGGLLEFSVDQTHSVGEVEVSQCQPTYQVLQGLDLLSHPAIVYSAPLAIDWPSEITIDELTTYDMINAITVSGGSGAYSFNWRVVYNSHGNDAIIGGQKLHHATFTAGLTHQPEATDTVQVQVEVIDLYAWEYVRVVGTIKINSLRELTKVTLASPQTMSENESQTLSDWMTVTGTGSGDYSYQWSIVGNAHGATILNPTIRNATFVAGDIPNGGSSPVVTVKLTMTDNIHTYNFPTQPTVAITVENEVNYPQFSVTSQSVTEPVSGATTVNLTINASEPVIGRNIVVGYETADITTTSISESVTVLPGIIDIAGDPGVGYTAYANVKMVIDSNFVEYLNDYYTTAGYKHKMFENMVAYATSNKTSGSILVIGDNTTRYNIKGGDGDDANGTVAPALQSFGFTTNVIYLTEMDSLSAAQLASYDAILYFATSYTTGGGDMTTVRAKAIEKATRGGVGLIVISDHMNTPTKGFAASANALTSRLGGRISGSVDRTVQKWDFVAQKATYGSNPILNGRHDMAALFPGQHAGFASSGIVELDVTNIVSPDYTAKNSSVTFTPGQSSRTISVNVLADAEVETAEQFKVIINNLAPNMLAPNHEGIITIESLPPREQDAYMFETYADAQAFMGSYTPPTTAEVFNTWHRFDQNKHFEPGDTLTLPAQQFTYKASGDYIVSLENNHVHAGFISPDPTDTVDISVTMASNVKNLLVAPEYDDDELDIVIGYNKVSSGETHVLMAKRQAGGISFKDYSGAQWGLVLLKFTSSSTAGSFNGVLKTVLKEWVPSNISVTSNATIATSNYLNDPVFPNWSRSGRTRARVVRTRDTVTAWCTQWAGASARTSNPLPGQPEDNTLSKIEIDLANEPLLAFMYNQPSAYGYCCHSQAQAEFRDVVIKGILNSNVVYISSTEQVWEYNFSSGAWEITNARTIVGDLGTSVLITNPHNNDQFVIDGSGNPSPI